MKRYLLIALCLLLIPTAVFARTRTSTAPGLYIYETDHDPAQRYRRVEIQAGVVSEPVAGTAFLDFESYFDTLYLSLDGEATDVTNGTFDLTTTGNIYAGDGTTSLPGISFASDTDMGFYRHSADEIRLYTSSGNQAMKWTYPSVSFAANNVKIDYHVTSGTADTISSYVAGTGSTPFISFENNAIADAVVNILRPLDAGANSITTTGSVNITKINDATLQDIDIFANTADTGDTTNGKSFRVWRKAAEGDDSFEMFIDQWGQGNLKSSGPIYTYAIGNSWFMATGNTRFTSNQHIYFDAAADLTIRDKGNAYATRASMSLSTGNWDFTSGDLTTTGIVGTPQIKTDTVTPTDLTITTGASKTVVLGTVVYDDLQFQVSSAKTNPANVAPTWETFTATTSEYAFSVDDQVDTYANEIPHWWKQGTTGHAHMHITTKAVPAQEQKARFTITFAYADSSEVWVEAPLTAELTIPISTMALTNFYLDLGDLTLTNYLIETQMKCRVERIAKSAGGTEYVGDIFITQVGVHFEKDTVGSRTETEK